MRRRATAWVTARDKIVRREIPMVHYQFAQSRVKGMVSFAGKLASVSGSVDLDNLAVSAYLQGLEDCLETIEGRSDAVGRVLLFDVDLTADRAFEQNSPGSPGPPEVKQG